jgi:arylsulfatase A-like enzyme
VPRLSFPSAVPSPVAAAAQKPRVILLMMMDDADYHDFGYHSVDAVTPNIDSIGEAGLVLSRYYSAGTICSPTRASLLTGNDPAHYGLMRLWPDKARNVLGDYYQSMNGLPANEQTLARSLAAEGYASLHIGKWHLGTSSQRFLPAANGFDLYEIMSAYPYAGAMRSKTQSGEKTVTSEWRAKYQADRIIEFLESNLASGKNLFINWWPIEPHAISEAQGLFYVPPTFDAAAYLAATGQTLDTSTHRGKLLAQMFAFDEEFGRVIAALKSHGVYDDSLVIATSDNGGYLGALSSTRSVSQYKDTLSEGGIRVPFAASWPNRFAAGTHSDHPMQSTDLYPTIMRLIGGAQPDAIDGANLAGLLLSGQGGRKPMFFSFRRVSWRSSQDDRRDDSFALIDGCDKIVQQLGERRYYNVCSDPGERSNLNSTNPARFQELSDALDRRRLVSSRFYSASQLDGGITFEHNERLNIHEGDLTIFATLNAASYHHSGTVNIYRRGQGINFVISNGQLTASLTGVADTSSTPSYRNVTLSTAMPLDGADHKVALVIRGYLFGGSTIDLFVDGERRSRVAAPVGERLSLGQSIYAVMDERVSARLGSPGVTMKDVGVYLTAIEPNEL